MDSWTNRGTPPGYPKPRPCRWFPCHCPLYVAPFPLVGGWKVGKVGCHGVMLKSHIVLHMQKGHVYIYIYTYIYIYATGLHPKPPGSNRHHQDYLHVGSRGDLEVNLHLPMLLVGGVDPKFHLSFFHTFAVFEFCQDFVENTDISTARSMKIAFISVPLLQKKSEWMKLARFQVNHGTQRIL